MSDRKSLSREYRERRLLGGVYRITNTRNGRYLLGHAANLASVRNHFQFAVNTGSAIHPALRQDWEALGGQAFTLEVLQQLEQRPAQSQAAFLDELRALEDLCHADLDASLAY